MLWPERDDDMLGGRGRTVFPKSFGTVGIRQSFAEGVKIARAGERFKACKSNALAGFAANAGLQQLISPVALSSRLPSAGNGGIGCLRLVFQYLINRTNRWRGHGLCSKWSGDALSWWSQLVGWS